MLSDFLAVYRLKNISFQDFVKSVLDYMFKYNILSSEEIELLQNKEYSKMTFGIEYPLLEADEIKIRDNGGYCRYWINHKFDNGKFYGCSQWWREKFYIYEPLFGAWIIKVFSHKLETTL